MPRARRARPCRGPAAGRVEPSARRAATVACRFGRPQAGVGAHAWLVVSDGGARADKAMTWKRSGADEGCGLGIHRSLGLLCLVVC